MKKSILFSFLLLLSLNVLSQEVSDAKVDEIADKICEQADRFTNVQTSEEFNYMYLTAARETGLIEALPKDQQEDAFVKSYYRIQRNCPQLLNILSSISSASDWDTLSEKPKSTIGKKDLKDFKARDEFYYRESDDAKTDVFIADGYWSDQFPDDTFTTLKMEWVNKTTFKLIFESSTNSARDKLSNPGDEYLYEVISKEEGYFLVSAWIAGQGRYQTFKMYYD